MTSLYTAIAENATPKSSELILCCYVNTSRQLQILRSKNGANWDFERVVFPKERFLFEAPPETKLEIHTSTSVTTISSDAISCICPGDM
jgi:hypothetical protein